MRLVSSRVPGDARSIACVVAAGVVAAAAWWWVASWGEAVRKEEQLVLAADEIRDAIVSYYVQSPVGARVLPRDFADLLDDRRGGESRHHLQRLEPDPVTGRRDWSIVRAADGGMIGVRSASNARPIHAWSWFGSASASAFGNRARYSEVEFRAALPAALAAKPLVAARRAGSDADMLPADPTMPHPVALGANRAESGTMIAADNSRAISRPTRKRSETSATRLLRHMPQPVPPMPFDDARLVAERGSGEAPRIGSSPEIALAGPDQGSHGQAIVEPVPRADAEARPADLPPETVQASSSAPPRAVGTDDQRPGEFAGGSNSSPSWLAPPVLEKFRGIPPVTWPVPKMASEIPLNFTQAAANLSAKPHVMVSSVGTTRLSDDTLAPAPVRGTGRPAASVPSDRRPPRAIAAEAPAPLVLAAAAPVQAAPAASVNPSRAPLLPAPEEQIRAATEVPGQTEDAQQRTAACDELMQLDMERCSELSRANSADAYARCRASASKRTHACLDQGVITPLWWPDDRRE